MANSVVIPQEIIDNVIKAVANADSRLLKNCAMVSSSFLLPSRKHLFSKIYLRDDHASCERLHQVLVENPVIQSFVTSIDITVYKSFKSRSLIAIFQLPFCRLESFSVHSRWQRSNWNDFSSELKDAISTIVHSSTLKTLYLNNVSVPTMLFHGTHLTKLELRSLVLLDDFAGEQSRLLTSAASEGVATTASHTVIDRCVWAFFRSPHSPTEPIFLPFMSHLRVFEISINPFSATMSDFDILSSLMRSLRVSLTSPATLEHLKLDIVFKGDDDHFDYYGFFNDLRHTDVWSHLDSIIIHPTGSQLQRVDINIEYTFRHSNFVTEPDKTKVMEPVLDALPLLREKGILFVEANEGEWRGVD